MTNDSEWGARITDPKTHLDKTYHVHVGAAVDALLLVAMTKGILTGDGDILRAKHARVLRAGQHNTWLEIVLDEGKNRQIRRILQHFEIEVLRLVRVAIGPLILGKLAKGDYRSLTSEEKSAMDRAIEYFS
jgi:23S rRNA pseudouridine2605 synthase